MNNIKKKLVFSLCLLFLYPVFGYANVSQESAITVDKCRIRYIPLKDPRAAGYMVIRNNGEKDRVIVSISTDKASGVMMHQTVMEGNMAKMKHLGQLTIPALGSVEMSSGGYHLMFMKISPDLKFGDTVTLNLHFKDGEVVAVEAMVVSIKEDRKGGNR